MCWLLAAGYLVRALAMAGAERRAAVALGRVPLRLAETSDWQSASFRPVRDGWHSVVLESADPTGPRSEETFAGAAEIEVVDPAAHPVYRAALDAQTIYHRVPTGIVYTGVGSFRIDAPSDGSWTLRVRVLRGDPRFARSRDAVYVQTPSRFDTG